MTNLTVSVDEQLIKQARVRAIHEGTSVSAKVREFLADYAGGPAPGRRSDPAAELLRMIDAVRSEARHAGQGIQEPGKPAQSLRAELYDGNFRSRAREDLGPEGACAPDQPPGP